MHLFDTDHRLYGGNAIVAGGLPLALGFALADRYRGRDLVTVCFFGDGAVAEGEFHETLNLASLWRLPLLFVCENNLYAMGTALDRAQAQTDLALRAASYEMPAWSVDGMDVHAVERAARTAVEAIRAGSGPHFLEMRTYRFRAHSLYDPDRYRDKAVVQQWMQRDPIALLQQHLRDADGVSDDELSVLAADVEAELSDAVAYAQSGHDEPVEQLTRWVYSDQPSDRQRHRRSHLTHDRQTGPGS